MPDPLDDVTARIVRDPDDDAARLDAAALFDATDPPRAEHVRLGVEVDRALLAHFLAAPDSPTFPQLPQRAQLAALEQQHARRWIAPLSFLEEAASAQPPGRVDRGFIREVTARADVLLDRADELALHPVEDLNLRAPLRGSVPLASVLALPLARRLRALFLVDFPLAPADYEALAACETLDRCQLIFLPRTPLRDDNLARLAASPRLRDMFLLGGDDQMRLAGAPQEPPRYWRSAQVARLEAVHGPLPWFRPARWADGYHAGHGLRLLRRLKAAGVPDLAVTAPPLGTFCPLSYQGLTDVEYGAVTRILDARGYELSGRGRLSYGVAKDGAAGWSGWTYWLDVTEYSDAPVADEIERALRRPG